MEKEIEIQGVDVSFDGRAIVVKGEKGETRRELYHPEISIEKIGEKIKVSTKSNRRKVKALVVTYVSHIKNMITGVKEGFEYKLKIIYTHFPIKVEVKEGEVLIMNFMGEKVPRKSKVLPGVSIEVKEDMIFVRGLDKEAAGQTAVNIERICKIKAKDLRIFEDGIYIVK